MALALAPRTDEEPAVAFERLAPSGGRHELAVVVLTQANRPAELLCAGVRPGPAGRGLPARARAQRRGPPRAGRDVDLPRLGPQDRLVVLAENVGIPGGRNLGAAAADARLLMFLDDDAELLGPTVLAAAVQRFAADDRLGAMAIRLLDEDGRTQRRHVPRVGGGSAARSGHVTHFIGAACAVRGRRLCRAWRVRPAVLLRDGGVGPVLAAPRRRLVHLVLRRPDRLPPAHHAVTAPRARAADRAEPHVGGAAFAPVAPLCVAYLLVWTLLAVLRGGSARQVLAGYRQAWLARPRAARCAGARSRG